MKRRTKAYNNLSQTNFKKRKAEKRRKKRAGYRSFLMLKILNNPTIRGYLAV